MNSYLWNEKLNREFLPLELNAQLSTVSAVLQGQHPLETRMVATQNRP